MERFFLQKNHNLTKRNYLHRMIDEKVECMKIAKKYGKQYWDGNRRYGYGGYKYIPGRLTPIAKKIIREFKLNSNSKILDLGCGKGYLLFEILKLIPKIKITGLEISKHAVKNSSPTIAKYIRHKDAKKKLPFKSKEFDLAISFGLFHNFNLLELERALKEFNRIADKKYLMVESYRNDKELFNLQCWALTCESFFSVDEWLWIYNNFNYSGDYEFIFFE